MGQDLAGGRGMEACDVCRDGGLARVLCTDVFRPLLDTPNHFINTHIALHPESKYVLIFFGKREVVFKFWRILGTQYID